MRRESNFNCPNYSPLNVVIKNANDCMLVDIDGKKYIDCIASYSAIN